jgi:hydrogenase maturation protein HypF
VVRERELVLRRARGYAPLPVHVSAPLPRVLAVGAQIKNTVALSIGTEVFLGQHIGDLETGQALSAFDQVAADLPRLYEVTPEFIACDLNPDYLSTKYAWQRTESVHLVQHHWAHALACMAENELEAPALAVVWDGAGFGSDGTIWGGEFLLSEGAGFQRVAHLRPFRLAGDGGRPCGNRAGRPFVCCSSVAPIRRSWPRRWQRCKAWGPWIWA